MDFKKDWAKLVMAVLALVAAFYWAMAFFSDYLSWPAAFQSTGATMGQIAGIVFFLGWAVYLLAKIFAHDIAKWVVLAIGVINTILLLINLFDTGIKESFLTYGAGSQTLTFLVVFAFFPLIKGIKKVTCPKNKTAA